MWRRDLARDVRGDESERKRKADLNTDRGQAQGSLESTGSVEGRHAGRGL
jgi:hypothetical protein